MKRVLPLALVVLGSIASLIAYFAKDTFLLCVPVDWDDDIPWTERDSVAESRGMVATEFDNTRRAFPVVGATCRATVSPIIDGDGNTGPSYRGGVDVVNGPLTAAVVAGLAVAVLGLVAYVWSLSRSTSTASRGSTVDLPDRQDILASLESRLDVLEAIDLATEWRTDVFHIIEAAPDPAAARRSLRELLQVSESGANAVLAMQLRRLTTSERGALRADVEALRHEHRQLSGRPPDDR